MWANTRTCPRDDDDDAGECKVPVALKDPKQVSATRCNRPDVTYSGHKGKGYEETCHEENATQLITHVEVTPLSGSDTEERAGQRARGAEGNRTSSSPTRRMVGPQCLRSLAPGNGTGEPGGGVGAGELARRRG